MNFLIALVDRANLQSEFSETPLPTGHFFSLELIGMRRPTSELRLTLFIDNNNVIAFNTFFVLKHCGSRNDKSTNSIPSPTSHNC